jgi:peroxiredoxin
VRHPRVAPALFAALAIMAAVGGCGGSGAGGVDKGGFTQEQRDAAQAGLDTLQHTSVSAIVVQTTTSRGLPVCRVHLARRKPAIFELLLVWIPKGQYSTAQTGNRYAWLTMTLNEVGPDLSTWHFGNSADYSVVKQAYGHALSPPVEPCMILSNGRIKETQTSPFTARQAATLLGRAPDVTLRRAPAFNLSRADTTGRLSLSSLRGQAVLLNFWNSGCYGCATQAARLQQAYEKWRPRGVVVVGVNEYDFTAAVRGFIRRTGITYPVVLDPSGVGKRYAVDNLPETLFLDKSGRIVTKVAGVATIAQLDERIRLALR